MKARSVGDWRTFEDCIAEFLHRGRDEEAEDLRDIRDLGAEVRQWPQPGFSQTFMRGDIEGGIELFTDDACHGRCDLLEKAQRSIWLSTFTLKDRDGRIESILCAKAKMPKMTIRMIVSPGRKRDSHAAQNDNSPAAETIRVLRRAGVKVFLRTNHTKFIVTDETHAFLGSANLHTDIFRDTAILLHSKPVAERLISYFQEIVGDDASDG